MFEKFWAWYERSYVLVAGVSLALFLLQVAHLVWLFGAVIWLKLFGVPLIALGDTPSFLIAIVDYTEVPALISISLIYINELRRGWRFENAFYLFLLNTQWLHLFWITDEVVVATFASHTLVAIPVWLAWFAILLDYAEVPVMLDTARKYTKRITQGRQ